MENQKQLLARVLNKTDVWKIHKKKPVQESHVNKLAGLQPARLSKKEHNTNVLQRDFRNFQDSYFLEHLWALVSGLHGKYGLHIIFRIQE